MVVNKDDIEERWKYQNTPRGINGEVLNISEQTKLLWDKMNKTKHHSKLLKNANKWIDSLRKDMFKDKCIIIEEIKDNIVIEHKFNNCKAPTIMYDNSDTTIYGIIYLKKNSSTHEIYINRKECNCFYKIKYTLLHEVLHWLDDCVGFPTNDHDELFFERLGWLKDKFKINSVRTTRKKRKWVGKMSGHISDVLLSRDFVEAMKQLNKDIRKIRLPTICYGNFDYSLVRIGD